MEGEKEGGKERGEWRERRGGKGGDEEVWERLTARELRRTCARA